ncbi:MAG: hypothetical protein KAH25_03885 [Bacteroidales bacterium]|nr:hypothetical protein [Bacteroidales bacterium]
MNKIYTFFFLLLTTVVFSQSIGIGEWRDELPYSEAIAIAVSDDLVYGATPNSMFTFRKTDNTMKRYSKINGLSDIGVSTINYNKGTDVLFIAYSNTNIDLLKEGSIVNISDIKRKQILGKKTINDIYFIDNIAYLSCGFGIVLVDVEREEIRDTWYIGDNGKAMEVFDITHQGDIIYASTEEGIRVADLTSDNLADFQSWSKISDIPNFDGVFNHIENQDGKVVANYHPENNEDIVYALDNNIWTAIELKSEGRILNLCSGQKGFYVMYDYSFVLYEANLEAIRKIYTYGLDFGVQGSQVIEDGIGYWVSDRGNGLLRTENFWGFTNYVLNGPRTSSVFDLASNGNRVVVASGGRTDSYGNLYRRDGVFTKSGSDWVNYSGINTPALDTMYDPVCASVNPVNTNQYALGTWGKGVIVFNEDGVQEAYGLHNSTLSPYIGTSKTLRIGGVVYDDQGNLWANCAGSNALMHRMNPQGEWTAWELGSSSSVDVNKMVIDSRSYKWTMVRQGGHDYMLVFDENQANGNQLVGLNGKKNQGNIPGNIVTALADDLDGEMWVGTNEGVAVIYNPTAIFEGGDYDAQQIIVEKDGYAQYLLHSEKIQAIAIDGGNRKWIGTERSGLYLLSPDGLDEIHHFTIENSPLFSNNIIAVEVMENGEIYIATNKGIMVYKGEASDPDPTQSNVLVYPNPVRPDYSGPIAISGLVRDANVKITNTYGGLVYETIAYGGQAIWDGRDLDGRKVNTGVYMVFITDDTGDKTMVTKILFIK